MRYSLQCFMALAIIFCLFTDVTEASGIDDVAKYIRSKVIQEESYKFGTNREFTLQDDKSILLKCTDNVDGISEILICLTERFFNSRTIYIYCVRNQGINGGGSPLQRVDGAFRVIEKCAVIAEWSEEKQGLRLKFILTDDRNRLAEKFKEFWKQGSLLIDNAILNSPWKTPQHIAAFQAWGRPKNWYVGEAEYVEPCKEIESFSRPIVVLMGTESFSAAEDFLVLLHSSKRATLVGSKTGGSTGQPLRFEFDYGVNGRICTKRNTYPDGREFVGVGIIPDVEVNPTQADIAIGRDVVLEKGIEVLKEHIAKPK